MISKRGYYIISSIILILICIWDRIVNIPKFPYCFLYNTQIDLYANMLYYILSSLNNDKSYDRLFNFCFTNSFLAFIMYWSLVLINPSTLYKKGISVPLLLVFMLHGGIFIICLCEQLFINRRTKPKYLNWISYVIYDVIYGIMLKVGYVKWKIKVYPFAYKSDWILVGVMMTAFVVVMIGQFIYIRLTINKNKGGLDNNKGEELIETK